ncbi:hypothetical protein SEA_PHRAPPUCCINO_110 [Mycobacterium phage Phrappuccino]|uniref:Uncharacterized protein n=1 Tax=Mycobacterium phage Phrappuccino TaxID=2591223 RepID=A0A514DDU5_9CAUD|nr:hypothetical protein KHQ87_gp110 [Mycobacterium phage Phrappuccino]QDH91785.1 hypothetical protein SEA_PHRAPPUCCINO_110 [Mycobacterium phage Phrappuccino]QIQ63227.1 hypothetical protein SEA_SETTECANDELA_110 [Mycobacterium phage Settecandela]
MGDVDTSALTNVHDPDKCSGSWCVVHNPSDHHMRGWEVVWRNDRGLFERVCPHGIGHPDPDQFAHWEKAAATWRPPVSYDVIDDPHPPGNPYLGKGVHGCDGCCREAM